MDLHRLPTPALIVDRGRLLANAQRMASRADALGVALRPHLKTTKSLDIARIALTGHGAAVSTLREAEHFAQGGIDDLLWAVCVPPRALDRAAALVDQGIRLILCTDDRGVAQAIAAHPSPLSAVVEIDSGDHRTGLLPEDEGVVAIAEALGDRLAGVLTHAGHSYDCRTVDAVRAVAEEERSAAVAAAEGLRRAGHSPRVISVGSTPTAAHAADLSGVTELRPGVYLFGDRFQVAIGSCTSDDLALSVLATVISARPGHAVIDAGGLALSKDRSTAHTPHDIGYGLVADVFGRSLGATIHEVHQEHGLIAGVDLKVGDRVRVWPNHACMTAAAYDRYQVVDGEISVVATWGRVNGW